MKKLLSLILALALLLPAAALADLPDISGLTDDELLELNHQIQLRLFSEQLVNGVEVPAGEYTVGSDLPAGVYRMEVVTPSAGGYLYVFASAERQTPVNQSFLGEYWGVMEIGKIELTDGNVLRISGNSLRIFPYTGLFH